MWWDTRMATRMALLLAAFSASVAAADAPCVFVNPSDTQASPGTGFATNPIEHVGSTLPIQWTTAMTNYTIALWQQNPSGGSAKLGPILFQTTEAAVTQSDWLVQLYSFKLTDSPIFFFWLRSGTAALQGLSGGESCTSHYFNITTDPVSSSSSTTAASTATSTTSGTSTSAVSSPTTSTAAEASSGLSTGAQAGIGVGVGIVAVAAIAAFFVWYRYIQKKRAALNDPQVQSPPNSYAPVGGSYYQDGATAYDPSTASHTPKPPMSEAPVEVPASSVPYKHQTGEPYWQGHQQQPAELGQGDRVELPS